MRLLLALLASASLLLAGCIQAPGEETPASTHDEVAASNLPDAPAPPADRIDGMTAKETTQDKVAPCPDGALSLPPGGWCAERTLHVEGRIGLDTLPIVELESVNGNVEIKQGAGDAWSFLAVVKTRGLTEDEARRALDEAWTWSHEDGQGGHHIKAGPRDDVPLMGSRVVGAQYVLVLPGWVHLDDVQVETTNGNLDVTGFRMKTLTLETTNGNVVAAGRADNVDLETTNGNVKAVLLPIEGGSWSLETTNGGIHLIASEHLTRGYDVDAETTNGNIQIQLTQGTVKDVDRNHKTFRTDGYDTRTIKTEISLETTNGGITVVG